ncbi:MULTISPECIES: EutP/PduV family microcompartment system protein [unclassified Enterococcus]|uniref:EutP/PduV family microcompartment system protein n=1 Tax=unclassified Enterococcus TaxID=2608891 RepID=UPI001A9A8F3D|nr:EutP/PduV family microcompartment system protein [Enterococcus sp. DIV1271a]MBO1300747.1 EutP/PduV family microcompartment system protein [Enterococcus sp. DIV1271a]
MKRIILMGAIGCGKTTLCQALRGEAIVYDKTQAVEFHPEMIDTPGEFILHRQYYSALTVTAAEAEVIGLVQSALDQEQIFSPGFGHIFPKEVIGIMTKVDLVTDEKELARVREQLLAAGATKLFEVSSVEKTGLEDLVQYLGGQT